MTESEKTKKAIYSLGFIKGILYNGIFADRIDCIDYAISALEEILEYRRIGSLNECRDAMEFWKTRQELDAKIEKYMEYEKIGTVEECREAVEKFDKAEKALNVILSGNYNDECNFCVHNDNPMANCQCISGDGSWCIHNAKWNGKTSEDGNLEGIEYEEN